MDFNGVTEALRQIGDRMVTLLPDLLAAAGIVLAGWALAAVLRFGSRKLVAAVLRRVDARSGRGHGLPGVTLTQDAPRIVAAFVYWTVLLFFAAAAMEKLPLPIVTSLLESMAYYLPNVLLAVVLAFIGLGAGSLANQWITGAAGAVGVGHAAVLGRVAQVGIVVVALIVGVQQIGINSSFLTVTLSTMLGVTLGGMALAFGLGSGPVVTNIMASYYAARAYRIGDVVRVSGVEGTVHAITPTTILLDCEDGQLHVPARTYCDEVSLVRRREA